MYEGYEKNLAIQQPVENSNVSDARSWLNEYDHPWWLVGGTTLYDNEWRIVDDGVGRTSRINWEYPLYDPITGKVTLLTDPEHIGLLEVAQRVCLALRDGHLSRIDSSDMQRRRVRSIMCIFAWMRLNFIYSLDQLTAADFRLYLKAATWNFERLLDVESRFNDYLDSLRRSGQKFPVRFDQPTTPNSKMPAKIAVFEIFRQIGIDPEMYSIMSQNFKYQFWSAVAEINGPELVLKNCRHYLEMEEEPERVPSGTKALENLVYAWRILHDMSYILPQKCNVDPVYSFIEGEQMSIKKICKEVRAAADIEEDEGITETIPDRQAFHILDRACRWVLIYADDLLDLRKRATQKGSRVTKFASTRVKRLDGLLKKFTPKNFTEEDAGAPWPLISGAKGKDTEGRSLTIAEASGFYLMAACAIVIAAFTARRRMEVLTIKGGEPTKADSAPRALYIDEGGEPWIWTYIEKTFQKWDRTPIPPVVVKAIEVLEALTESTRKASGSRCLFEIENLAGETGGGKHGTTFRLLVAINLFATFVEVPLLENGSKWVFKPHQFRRFFALLFMYRYNYGEAGKMEVLFHQLRHFNMEMTKRYIEEIYESDMLKAHSKHVAVDMMSEVLRGERKALGPGGEAMKQHLDEMLNEVIKDSEVLSGRENAMVAHRIAERVMDKLNIEMVPFKWGFCYAYKAAEDGKFCGNCIAENDKADKPNVAQATPKRCLGCDHLYVDEDFRVPWEMGAKSYRARAENGCHTDTIMQYAVEYAEVYEEGMRRYFGA